MEELENLKKLKRLFRVVFPDFKCKRISQEELEVFSRILVYSLYPFEDQVIRIIFSGKTIMSSKRAGKIVNRTEEEIDRILNDVFNKIRGYEKEKKKLTKNSNIEMDELSFRTRKRLEGIGIKKVKDILLYTKTDLLMIEGFGRKCRMEVDEYLYSRCGLELKW